MEEANHRYAELASFSSSYNEDVADGYIRNAPPQGLYPSYEEEAWFKTMCLECGGIDANGEYFYGSMSHCSIVGAPWDANPASVLNCYNVLVLAPWMGMFPEACVF
jgi:hypothetical protein